MNFRKLFRWSLRTQVVVVLFMGYLLVLWEWREPWVFAGEATDKEINSDQQEIISPDKTRIISVRATTLFLNDYPSFETLVRLRPGRAVGRFLDNDTILALTSPMYSPVNSYSLLRRRFPEWWWGHFYRPEVWLFPLWLGLIVWTIRKDRAVQA